jgi:hypothetical protein
MNEATAAGVAPKESIPEGCTAELNKCLSERHQIVHWIDKNVAPGETPTLPEWQSKAVIDGSVVGIGYGGRIRIARNVASYHALVALGLRDTGKVIPGVLSVRSPEV